MMNVFVEALNLAGGIGAVLSFPPLALVVILYLIFARKGEEMSSRKKLLIGILLVVGALAYAADLADRFGWTARLETLMPLVAVSDQAFVNERVILDGHSYNHCTFDNVKFVYNGGVFELKNSKIGSYWIASDDRKIDAAIGALNGLGALRFAVHDKAGNIIPPYGTNPSFGAPK